jgi:hypothetical protein
MAESKRLIEVTEAEKARFKDILVEHLPGDQYAEIREICMKNLALRKYSHIQNRIQERYPGESADQVWRRARAWEKFCELRQIPAEKDTKDTNPKDGAVK